MQISIILNWQSENFAIEVEIHHRRFMIKNSMSEEKSESAPTETPVMDDETYAFVQEVFQLARGGDAERLKEFLKIWTRAEHPRRQGQQPFDAGELQRKF